jgi:hypothetical protein
MGRTVIGFGVRGGRHLVLPSPQARGGADAVADRVVSF